MDVDSNILIAPNLLSPPLQTLMTATVVSLLLAWMTAVLCMRSSIAELLLSSHKRNKILLLEGVGGAASVVDTYSRRHLKAALQARAGAALQRSLVVQGHVLFGKGLFKEPARLSVQGIHAESDTLPSTAGSPPSTVPHQATVPSPPPPGAPGGPGTTGSFTSNTPDSSSWLHAQSPLHRAESSEAAQGVQQLSFELKLWCDCIVTPVWGLHVSALHALHSKGTQGLRDFHAAGGVPSFLRTCHSAMVEWHQTEGRVRASNDEEEAEEGGVGSVTPNMGSSSASVTPISPVAAGGVRSSTVRIRLDPVDAPHAHTHAHAQAQAQAGTGIGGAGNAPLSLTGTGDLVSLFEPADCVLIDKEHMQILRCGGSHSSGAGAGAATFLGTEAAGRPAPTIARVSVPIPAVLPPMTLDVDHRLLCALVVQPLPASQLPGRVGAADLKGGAPGDVVHALVIAVHLEADEGAEQQGGHATAAASEPSAAPGAALAPVPVPAASGSPIHPSPAAPSAFTTHGTTLVVLLGRALQLKDVYIEGTHAEGSTGTGKSVPEPLCVVCLSSAPSACLLPCGHLAVCTTCNAHIDKCPVCRAEASKGHMVVPPGLLGTS